MPARLRPRQAAQPRRGPTSAPAPDPNAVRESCLDRVGRMPPALSVRSLRKRYGRVEALGGVDLDVEEGELVGLHGPNGAGKSTLVKIVCGLVRPTAGEALVCGQRAGSPPARASL